MFGMIVINRDLQVGDTLEDATPDAFTGDLGEETLDQGGSR